jgi:hypothetical protein
MMVKGEAGRSITRKVARVFARAFGGSNDQTLSSLDSLQSNFFFSSIGLLQIAQRSEADGERLW